MKKVLLGLLGLVVVGLATFPYIAGLFGVNIGYDQLLKIVGLNTTPKKEAPRNALAEGEVPKSFDAAKCDELLDLGKFPDTVMNGKVFRDNKATDAVFASGQARIKDGWVELSLFSSTERASCAATKADGSPVDDVTLTIRVQKEQLDQKGDQAALKYGWDLFGKQPLEYSYLVGGAEVKEPLAGLVGGISLDAKAGGKVKGKGILCFAHPNPNAPPPPKPSDYEEGDPLPPVGDRYAVAGNFSLEFCP